MTGRRLLVHDAGRLGYADGLALQRAAAAARIDGRLGDDLLILCEHPPVVTIGRATKAEAGHLLLPPEALAERGCELHEVERGGDVTFHGPGQLVGYPIMALSGHRQDLHWYLRQVEQALIDASAVVGVTAGRSDGYTGVWVGDRKLASIGVHARQWVTWHGFALNVTTDLSWFDVIVPCGIAGVKMTSWAAEGVGIGAAAEAAAITARAFGRTFGLAVAPVGRPALNESLASEASPPA